MTKYQIGDVVRIRDDIGTNPEFKADRNLDRLTDSMVSIAGREFDVVDFTQSGASDDGTGDRRCVRYAGCYWLDRWLEPVNMAADDTDFSGFFDDLFQDGGAAK